jgi:hypothetical protein
MVSLLAVRCAFPDPGARLRGLLRPADDGKLPRPALFPDAAVDAARQLSRPGAAGSRHAVGRQVSAWYDDSAT